MKKQYVSYGIVGIAVGLVIGFIVANWTYKGSSANQQVAGNQSTSVNTGGAGASNPELPPGHPPIPDSGSPTSAPPLPAGSSTDETSSGASASATPGGSVELPSLDPLPASSKEERAEHKYKNIQLLKGLPADRVTSIMFAFKSSLGVDCTYCHIKDQFEKDDKSTKQMARKMITLVRDTNAKLGGARVNCFTCHRGQPRPPQ
ncbi:MAG TPA: photosynthetic reaction center cytochrome c subunit family protein [Blastocatellia bacterium]|nr:photosynthetic reaction center cytochrome c subunit family protein [Blastocatellia bacterium]